MKYAIKSERGFVRGVNGSGSFVWGGNLDGESRYQCPNPAFYPVLFRSVEDAVKAIREREQWVVNRSFEVNERGNNGLTIVGVRKVSVPQYEEVEL